MSHCFTRLVFLALLIGASQSWALAQRGGWGGPGEGGGPGGGWGGPGGGGPGGGGGWGGRGGFDPSSFVDRLDQNQNGMLDPDEMQGPAQFMISRMQRDDPSIRTDRPIPLSKIKESFERARSGVRRIGVEMTAIATTTAVKWTSGSLRGCKRRCLYPVLARPKRP